MKILIFFSQNTLPNSEPTTTTNSNARCESNQKLLKFLNKLVNFYATIDSKEKSENTECIEFLKLYDTKSFSSTKTAFIYATSKAGGIEISELILVIFACLIWHQPVIKYENIFKKTIESASSKTVNIAIR